MSIFLTTIILIAIIIISFYSAGKYAKMPPSRIMFAAFGSMFFVLLLLHIGRWIGRGEDYRLLLTKRDVITNALYESRKINNNLESAAILKDIIDFNTSLAEYKYYNKAFILGQYVDDRVEDIEPIK